MHRNYVWRLRPAKPKDKTPRDQAFLSIASLRSIAGTVELYVIGGYVRDTLIKKKPGDIDLLIVGQNPYGMYKLLSRFGKTIYTMPARGFMVWMPDDSNNTIFDVAVIRKKDGSIYQNMTKRDITINALARRIYPNGTLSQPIGHDISRLDIQEKQIRMIDRTVFQKDPIYSLRAIRFATVLGWEITLETLNVITEMSSKIEDARERQLYREIMHITLSENYIKGWDILYSVGWSTLSAKEIFSNHTIPLGRLDQIVKIQPIRGISFIKENFNIIQRDMMASRNGIHQASKLIRQTQTCKRQKMKSG